MIGECLSVLILILMWFLRDSKNHESSAPVTIIMRPKIPMKILQLVAIVVLVACGQFVQAAPAVHLAKRGWMDSAWSGTKSALESAGNSFKATGVAAYKAVKNPRQAWRNTKQAVMHPKQVIKGVKTELRKPCQGGDKA